MGFPEPGPRGPAASGLREVGRHPGLWEGGTKGWGCPLLVDSARQC
jgi:hypothetical protein